MRNNVVEAIQDERYTHQVRGQVIGITMVLRVAAEKRYEIRDLTNAARARAISAGANPTPEDAVVVAYEPASRGTEPVWMPQGGGRGRGTGGGRGQAAAPVQPVGQGPAEGQGRGGRGRERQSAPQTFALQNVPVWLKYDVTRTVPRASGYVIPASIAKVVPLPLDHGIQVHRFTEPTTMELEVYEATGVRQNGYFQGHYLKAVTGVEKKTEKVEMPAGWFYVSTAQAKGHLISYIMEPETDDNLITLGLHEQRAARHAGERRGRDCRAARRDRHQLGHAGAAGAGRDARGQHDDGAIARADDACRDGAAEGAAGGHALHRSEPHALLGAVGADRLQAPAT